MQVGRAEPRATIINFSLGCGTQPLPSLKLLMVLGTRPPGSEHGAGRAPNGTRELQSAPPSPATLLSAPPRPVFPSLKLQTYQNKGAAGGLTTGLLGPLGATGLRPSTGAWDLRRDLCWVHATISCFCFFENFGAPCQSRDL